MIGTGTGGTAGHRGHGAITFAIALSMAFALAGPFDPPPAAALPGPVTAPVASSAITGAVGSLSAGDGHACAVTANGSLACWGNNSNGQATPPSGTFVAVSAGGRHACAIRTDGTAVCWGLNSSGQTNAPQSMRFVAISAGGAFTCGIRVDRTLYCWGDDTYGELDTPTGTFGRLDAGATHACATLTNGNIRCWGDDGDVASPPFGAFVAISAGSSFTCGIRPTGELLCWGGNMSAQTPPGGQYVAISAGANHACAITPSGTVTCWGSNGTGQTNATTATAIDIASGTNFSCATLSSGLVSCWGDDSSGQLVAPSVGGRIRSISASVQSSCAIRSNGTAACWGTHESGGASVAPTGTFVSVASGGEASCGLEADGSIVCWGQGWTTAAGYAVAVSYGVGHGCAIRPDGSVNCWGTNTYGEGTPPNDGGRYVTISAGYYFTCGLRFDGTLACWGTDDAGQASAPSGSFVDVSAGGFHACAIRADGTLTCWGDNTYGQLLTPAGTYRHISAGLYQTCGLRTDGQVVCWGAGATTPPAGLYTSVAAGWYHTCATTAAGALGCWGEDGHGQRTIPVPGKPTGVTATRGNASASVSWTAATATGAISILSYTVTASPSGRTCRASRGAVTCKVTGLTNGSSYVFTVTADNGLVVGPASFPSNAVVPATVPGAPTGVKATARNASAIVTWTAPASTGGSAITGYTVTSSPDGKTCNAAGAATSCTVQGLTNGTWYTFSVKAANAVGTGPASAASPPVLPLASIVREGAADAFATAAAVSRATFPANCACTAYVAVYNNWPDALAGAAAAGKQHGSMLFVASTGTINASTTGELTRLKPSQIVVLGGTGVVSAGVYTALSSYAPSITRWWGSNRFGTAASVSSHLWPANCNCTAYIAYAYNYPDALAGAAAAGLKQGPVLLVDSTGSINASTLTELKRLKPSHIVVLGGTGVVSAAVYNLLSPLTPSIARYWGSDRFATAADVSSHTFAHNCGCIAYVASGTDPQGALAGAAAAGMLHGPLLLVNTSGPLPAATATELTRLAPYRIVVVGDPTKVSAAVYTLLSHYVP